MRLVISSVDSYSYSFIKKILIKKCNLNLSWSKAEKLVFELNFYAFDLNDLFRELEAQDTTTLLHNEEESFALAPVDVSAIKGFTRAKR